MGNFADWFNQNKDWLGKTAGDVLTHVGQGQDNSQQVIPVIEKNKKDDAKQNTMIYIIGAGLVVLLLIFMKKK